MGAGEGRGGNYQLAERAPDNAGEGQVGVWLKEGRSGRGGREGGRGHLFVGIDLCGGGAGDSHRAPVPGRGWGEERAPGPSEEAPRETRGQSSPAAGRTPLSRSVNSTKKGYACS